MKAIRVIVCTTEGAALDHSYLSEFPIPADELPTRLRRLLEPVADNPQLPVEVTSRIEVDQYGPNSESVQMVMVLAQNTDSDLMSDLRDAGDCLVSFSRPNVYEKGGLARFDPSVSGADYIVASWGGNSFYSYHLAEKVWMALGLSPRCVGGDQQKIEYDDLSLPEFGVVVGELSTDYHWSLKRNVRWTMSNAFLRRYLWMRGAYGVRVFSYEALLPDGPKLRSLMDGKTFVQCRPDAGWYDLTIREHKGGLLIQVSAAVLAVTPELCPEQSADGLVWPGITDPMTRDRANALVEFKPVYLDDRFLERYEQRSVFNTTPAKSYRFWHCSPSYRGQWSFTDCVRVGRNLVRVPMRELYKAKPDREIIHAHAHVLDPARVLEFDLGEEHIVSKTSRLVDQLLNLGENLAALSGAIGVRRAPTEIIKYSREELQANGWLNYPELSRLAQVAPVDMSEQAFLSRCKCIYELWQPIPNETLRNLIVLSGHSNSNIKEFKSIKLLQALVNITERLNAAGERVDAFAAGTEPSDLTKSNSALKPLFINKDLRIADAHNAGGVARSLKALGFDTAELNQGYGRALDRVFDCVINAFSHMNSELAALRSR